jgi:hypothetical protein
VAEIACLQKEFKAGKVNWNTYFMLCEIHENEDLR